MKKLILMIVGLFMLVNVSFAQSEQKIRIGLDIVLKQNDKIIYESEGVTLSGYNRSYLIENNVSYIKGVMKNKDGVIEIIPGVHKSGVYLTVKPILIDNDNISIEYSLKDKTLISLDDFEVDGQKVQIPKDFEAIFTNTIKMKPDEMKTLTFNSEKNIFNLEIKVNY